MDNQYDHRTKFLADFEKLQHQFQQSLYTAQNNEIEFKEECIKFQQNIKKHLDSSSRKLATDNPLTEQMNGFANLIHNTSRTWQERIDKKDTGVKFREGFNDSLMVFVYGKVKSGKSSLGNYVAWGNTDPTEQLKVQTKSNFQPKYFSHTNTGVANGDSEKQAETTKEFRVGATEATSSIQGFSLPGLTWIDSPGLHSKNAVNGELARDYVKHSDLILYTMKSDSPARQSDLEEITELYHADKQFLLLITGSDETEEDYDEELNDIVTKTIMKDEERRAKQRQYTKTELSKIDGIKDNIDKIQIVSFSARYAQENYQDSEAFQDSGMGILFDILQHTIHSDGVKLKKQVPLRNFKSFLRDFQEDLNSYYQFADDFSEKFAKMENDINREIRKETTEINKELNTFIQSSFRKIYDSDRDNEQSISQQINHLKQEIDSRQKQLIKNSQNKILQKFMQNFGDSCQTVVDNSDLYNLPEFSIEKKEVERIVTIIPGTKKRNSGFGALVGTIGGALLGGGVGAVIGGAIGGGVGGLTGTESRSQSGSFSVNIGDNLSEIESQITTIIKTSINEQMEKFSTNVINDFLQEVQKLTANIKTETEHTEHFFNNLSANIDKQLANMQ